MGRALVLVVAVGAAVGWLVYEWSIPAKYGPPPLIRDASSLAIGIGVYLFGQFLLARPLSRAPLPRARKMASDTIYRPR